MRAAVDRIINDPLHEVDVITGRKRVFAFMADEVTDLHRSGDAVALMVITKMREL